MCSHLFTRNGTKKRKKYTLLISYIIHPCRPATPSVPPVYEESEELFNDESTESIPTDKLRAPVSREGRPSPATESPGTDAIADENTVSTTEGDNGLTAAMMDKAALDLYAIFQQAQDENASNYVDENATNSSLDDDDDSNTTDEVTNDFFICQFLYKVTKPHTLI
jgi:hypothetical protein